jgi:HlyD family secretion protein
MERLVKPGLLVAGSLLLLAGCVRTPAAPQGEAAGAPVTTYRVAARSLPETMLLPGRVIPQQEAQVSAAVPGRVRDVLIKTGDTVTAGQVLAVLDTGDGGHSVEAARQTLQSLEAQYRQMQSQSTPDTARLQSRIAELQREAQAQTAQLEALTKSKKIPDPATLFAGYQRLTAIQGELASLQSQVAVQSSLAQTRAPMLQALQGQIAQARQAVQLAEAQSSAARVTAPIGGVVLTVNATPGSPAAPGMPLFSVGNVSQLDFELMLDPNVQRRLQPGQPVHVQIGEAAPVDAQLRDVSPAPQPESKSFTAHTDLLHPDHLKPGMVGQGIVTLAPHENVLAVPKAALLQDDKGPYVLTAKKSTAAQTRVERGYDNGTWVEIRKGLAAGDAVIYEGVDRVQPGSKLLVVKTETKL